MDLRLQTTVTTMKLEYSEDGQAYTPRAVGNPDLDITASPVYILAGCNAAGEPTATQLGCTQMYTSDRTICTLTVCDPCTRE